MPPAAGATQATRVVLGVSGGIAAYKAVELLRRFTESGHEVRVIPTEGALHFIGAATWAGLSGHPVHNDVWAGADRVEHVRVGQRAALVVVAPATADLLARAAAGRADDLLTATLLTARCPVLFAPAMHTEMWEHPATRANVATLRDRGAVVVEPAVGRLTGPDSGRGRLPDPAEIFAVASRLLVRGPARPDLAGRRVVVTAGGTREYLDPVRYLGNSSSGKQGYAFARTAAARGARVTLVAANTVLADPAGVDVVRVVSTEDLRAAVLTASAGADAVVMAAAPADFRPAEYSPSKIKKSDGGTGMTVELVRNPDVAAELGAAKPAGQVLVAFAAETDDAIANARAKLDRKRADLIVVNLVGRDRTFGADRNAATVLGADGSVIEIPECGKDDLADRVWDLVADRLRR
ncbi:MAG TPA: bifunctional phosphopantothenoylcysteine decarboxylase/phosphopantothenate--cysteine ligase CoaBC [Mycobacteriales bacterium]|nr:bifunctional phosphopantothenoylcysteine decarboxylase/phosphopantothenate--cysteine ligase CoaBC [Mycobacteriales bacterium]